jgi:hypothetical protein
MVAISTRTPSVTILYNFKKDGKTERREKKFKDAYAAKAFFTEKDKKGKKPEVKANKKALLAFQLFVAMGDQAKPAQPPVKPKQSLAEAFPVEKGEPAPDKAMRATGDPTRTEFVNGELTEDQMKKEAKKKVADAKKLRKQQKKGVKTWLTPETKTVVKATWHKPEAGMYDRWLIKFSDGTEASTSYLGIQLTRDNPNHHLQVGGMHYIDGLSNKDYEAVLKKSFEYAQQQANRYKASLANFKASDSVQKEMDKKVSKREAKAAPPLTPQELELANKLAALANKYCITPAAFFKSDEELRKNPHNAHISRAGVDGLFASEGIDPAACSIAVTQAATAAFRKLEPRLGGADTATTETTASKGHSGAATATEGKETAADTKKPAKAAKAPGKPKGEVDAFGNQLGTGAATINAAVLAHSGTITAEGLEKATKLPKGRINSHLKYLVERGHLTKGDKGWSLAAQHTMKPKAEAKATKKPAKAQAKKADKKSATKAKPAKAVKGKTIKKAK